jgi:hypothetical protein
MQDYRRGLNFIEIKKIAEQWAEEYEASSYDDWCHPYSNQTMTVTQVLWSLHTERDMSVSGMRGHFERHMRAVNAR